MVKAGLLSAALAAFVALPAAATTIHEPYSSFWVLGDSLSDNGSTDPVGSVSTNDTVWNDGIIDEFDRAGKTTVNLAYGGATATGSSPIDLAQQVQDFALSPEEKGTRPLVSVWFGGNDLLAGFTPQNALAAAATVGSAITTLQGLGVNDFLVFTLPDLGKIPLTQSAAFTQEQRAGISAISSLFNSTLASLFPTDAHISYIDVFTLTSDVTDPDNPFGFSSTATCQGAISPTCEETPFWDAIHPSSAAHDIIETEVRAALAPIPLPAGAWLLLTGLGLVLGFKRKQALA